MNTKFIGLEGFNEIEGLTKNSKKAQGKSIQKNNTKKTVRFLKRLSVLCAKKAKRVSSKLISKAGIKLKAKKAANAKSQTLILDRQYNQNRKSTDGKSSAIESLSYLKKRPSGKAHAHSANSTAYRTHTVIKKRAVLTVVASLTAIMLSCMTVASALDAPQSDNTQPQKASAPVAVTAVEELNYELDEPEMFVNTGLSSLYIDGELIGTTSEVHELDAALEQLLIDYRADYDDTTTTEFENDVVVEKHAFDDSELMTAEEIMNAADGKFSIRLSTDWSYDMEIDYDVDVTYDEDKDSDYEKVVTEGEKGAEEINVRLTYVDGLFVESEVIDTRVKKYPVTEDIIKGSKQGVVEEETTGVSTGSFIWPLYHTHTVSSYFEWRWGRMHQGIDIAGGGDYGQPIIAADGGVVTFAGDDGGGYGYYVMIDHGNGYVTLYGHASSLAVSTGEYVSQGQTIAYVGSTGNSTGPHLHFEIRENGVQLDPLGFVQ